MAIEERVDVEALSVDHDALDEEGSYPVEIVLPFSNGGEDSCSFILFEDGKLLGVPFGFPVFSKGRVHIIA